MSLVNLYFRENLDNINKEFIRAAIAGDTDEAKRLIEQEPNVVNYQDERSGLTGLMIFTADGCGSMVDLICGLPEADVTLEDKRGRTAGFMAIAIGREDIRQRIDDRVTEELFLLDPELREDELDDDTPSSDVVIRFPGRPKGGSDPSP